METAPLGQPLPDDKLACRAGLPLKPALVTLTGQYVRLLPLDLARDLQPLYAVSNGSPITLGERSMGAYNSDAVIWRYMFAGPFATVESFAAYLRTHLDAPNILPFCVFDQQTAHQIGVATYMSNVPEHLRIELGSIWYSPVAQGTHANTEATYLMLAHAFALGYRRVEWKCNALNDRSRRAALRLGFQCEGIQEYHMVIKGRNRDTAWFRMLDHEWPGVKQHLEQRLYG